MDESGNVLVDDPVYADDAGLDEADAPSYDTSLENEYLNASAGADPGADQEALGRQIVAGTQQEVLGREIVAQAQAGHAADSWNFASAGSYLNQAAGLFRSTTGPVVGASAGQPASVRPAGAQPKAPLLAAQAAPVLLLGLGGFVAWKLAARML